MVDVVYNVKKQCSRTPVVTRTYWRPKEVIAYLSLALSALSILHHNLKLHRIMRGDTP